MVVPQSNYLSVKKTRERKPRRHFRAEWIPTMRLINTFTSRYCVLVTQIPDQNNSKEQRFSDSDSQFRHGVVGRDTAGGGVWKAPWVPYITANQDQAPSYHIQSAPPPRPQDLLY